MIHSKDSFENIYSSKHLFTWLQKQWIGFEYLLMSMSHLLLSLTNHAWHVLPTPGSLQLRCLCSQHPLHPGGTYGHVADDHTPSTFRQEKNLIGVKERQVGRKEKRNRSCKGCKQACNCMRILCLVRVQAIARLMFSTF